MRSSEDQSCVVISIRTTRSSTCDFHQIPGRRRKGLAILGTDKRNKRRETSSQQVGGITVFPWKDQHIHSPPGSTSGRLKGKARQGILNPQLVQGRGGGPAADVARGASGRVNDCIISPQQENKIKPLLRDAWLKSDNMKEI